MEDWVLERLGEFLGRNDRQALGPHVGQALTRQSMGDHRSYRVDRNLSSLGKGLVVAEEGVVPDYARVRRVFHLTNAIVKYYYSPFYLEALVPGYQARVAWLGGGQVGFTRDGRYCAFASDRAPDFIPDAFFADHPKKVVCLTIGGRTPYANPAADGGGDEVVAWGTEILEMGVREPIATGDKYELFEKYGIKAAEKVGPFDATDVDRIVEWMKEFEAAGGRGVVLKPSERHHRPLKYALPSSLLNGAPAWLGLDEAEDGVDPCFERLVQAACAATELGKQPGDWDWDAVGRSLLMSLATLAEEIAEGGALTKEYSVWLHDKDAAAQLMSQLEERARGATVEQLALEEEADGWRLRFERRFADVTAALQRRLSGASYRD